MLKSVQAIILTINYLSLPGFPAWYGGNAGGDVKGDRGGTDNIVFNTGNTGTWGANGAKRPQKKSILFFFKPPFLASKTSL
jgi:hypothetical protein